MSSNDTSMSLLTQLKIQIPCLAQEGQKGMVIYYINIAKHRVKKFPQEENNAITKIKMGRGRMAENRRNWNQGHEHIKIIGVKIVFSKIVA